MMDLPNPDEEARDYFSEESVWDEPFALWMFPRKFVEL